MKTTFLGVLGCVAVTACSGPTSGAAKLAFDNGGPVAGYQFGALGSSLAYPGPFLVAPLPSAYLPDASLNPQAQDAGPAVLIEMYTGAPGVTCNQPYSALSAFIVDAGPAANNNSSLQPQAGMYPLTILITGFPNSGLATGSVPLAASAVGATSPTATLSLYQIDGSEIVSVGGSINVTASSSSSVTGTITGVGQPTAFGGPTFIATAQAADVAAVYAAGFNDPQFDADADAGAAPSVLYADALNDALDGGFDAGALAAALLADPDAGGTFILEGNFDAPFCPTLYIPQP